MSRISPGFRQQNKDREVENLKKVTMILLLIAIIAAPLLAPATAGAYPGSGVVNGAFYVDEYNYVDLGTIYGMDVAPFVWADRTYVPVRYLAYVLGMGEADISYDPYLQLVTLNDGATNVDLYVNDPYIYVNGNSYPMDAAPMMVNDRLFLPARYVAEAFAATVSWDGSVQEVSIYRP